MFEGMKKFLKRGDGKMADYGLTDLRMSGEMREAIGLWTRMYESREGLRLPAAISSEMARLITLELRSGISGSKRAEYLDREYQKLIENIKIPIELGCAYGGVVFKPYYTKGEIAIDFVRAEDFYPTAFDGFGRITGAVFVQKICDEGIFYTRLERHSLSKNTYRIENRAYQSKSPSVLGREIPIKTVDAWANLATDIEIGNVKAPLFGYFKPSLANSIDKMSPLGVSVFGNATNLIDDANAQYERLLWEFKSGERALIANSMAFRTDKNGKPQLPDRRLYRTLDVDDVDFFREWSPEFRDENIIRGLDRIFRQIEFNCGLAYGTLSGVDHTEKTAEEIRASKQRSYATICDNQKALRRALSDLVYAMDVWCTLYNLAPIGKYEVSFEFDDSIAADRKTEFGEKCELVGMGVMQPWEMRAWYFGEKEDTAKKNLE